MDALDPGDTAKLHCRQNEAGLLHICHGFGAHTPAVTPAQPALHNFLTPPDSSAIQIFLRAGLRAPVCLFPCWARSHYLHMKNQTLLSSFFSFENILFIALTEHRQVWAGLKYSCILQMVLPGKAKCLRLVSWLVHHWALLPFSAPAWPLEGWWAPVVLGPMG